VAAGLGSSAALVQGPPRVVGGRRRAAPGAGHGRPRRRGPRRLPGRHAV